MNIRLSRQPIQRLGFFFIHFGSKILGYGYFRNFDESGEAFFINRISETSPRNCIDVGANVGKYSKLILEKTSASVIAFEPNPIPFETLLQLKSQNLGRFSAYNLGVGGKSGELELFFGVANSEVATFSVQALQMHDVKAINIQSLVVNVHSLDEFFCGLHPIHKLDNCDLLKIDTEGLEYDVLSGAQIFIEEIKPRFIQI